MSAAVAECSSEMAALQCTHAWYVTTKGKSASWWLKGSV